MKADKEGGWNTGPAPVFICLTCSGRRMGEARKRACGSAEDSASLRPLLPVAREQG